MSSSVEQLNRFTQEVLRDQDLQHPLRDTTDQESFLQLVISLGRERGYHFSGSDVEAALAAARRTWLERWIG